MAGTRRMSTAAMTGLLLGGGGSLAAYAWWHHSPHSARGRVHRSFPASAIPTDPRGRFRYYATRGADGQDVLDPAGLIACVCLLDEKSRQMFLRDAYQHLPPHVRRRLRSILDLMDIDNDNSIGYEEFCIFFTLLSTRREYLKTAFRVFDKNEDGTLSYDEFRHLLNALMIDPSVKIVSTQRSSAQEAAGPMDCKNPQACALTFTNGKLFASPLARRFFGPRCDRGISFDELWSLIHDLREEVWGIEFGLCDPHNTGHITLKDFRRIIFRGVGAAAGGGESDACDQCKTDTEEEKVPKVRAMSMTREKEETEEPTSWDFFLKVLDIIFEYERVSHLMHLALKAKPPGDVISNTHQQHDGPEVKPDTSDVFCSNTGEGELNSEEFYHVIENCQGLFHVTKRDADQLVRIFDLDGSGKLSPSEFARMCQQRTSYFLPRVPQFGESPRRAARHFFFCMQQFK